METKIGNKLEAQKPETPGSDIQAYFRALQSKCDNVLLTSLTAQNATLMASSRQFWLELEAWRKILDERLEAELLKVASLEYEFALLALAQGQYRHAFKTLRLVLELCLQAITLSANELRLREWLDNRSDTIWNQIIDEESGVFSKRFALAFFPDLAIHVQNYRSLAVSVYRECSECVHGNIPKHVPLPTSLEFDAEVFALWHSKSEIVARIVHFGLCLRYLCDLKDSEITTLEPFCLTALDI
jgi:hypothetical protein